MTSFWLVRHGQTDWNLAGRWQGQSPDAPPLNEVGLEQVLALRPDLKNIRLSAIYTSDLLRARRTAEVLAEPLGLDVILEPRFREMDLGVWEGMLGEEIKAKFPEELAKRTLDPVHTPAPGGESPVQVAARVVAAANEIILRHAGESVMIVGHGISLAALACLSWGIPLECLYEYIPENANLFRIEWETPEKVKELRR